MKKQKKIKQQSTLIRLRFILPLVAGIVIALGFITEYTILLEWAMFPIFRILIALGPLVDPILDNYANDSDRYATTMIAILIFSALAFYFLVGLGIEKLIAYLKSKNK